MFRNWLPTETIRLRPPRSCQPLIVRPGRQYTGTMGLTIEVVELPAASFVDCACHRQLEPLEAFVPVGGVEAAKET